jgi:hypothetical protein
MLVLNGRAAGQDGAAWEPDGRKCSGDMQGAVGVHLDDVDLQAPRSLAVAGRGYVTRADRARQEWWQSNHVKAPPERRDALHVLCKCSTGTCSAGLSQRWLDSAKGLRQVPCPCCASFNASSPRHRPPRAQPSPRPVIPAFSHLHTSLHPHSPLARCQRQVHPALSSDRRRRGRALNV